MMTSFLLPLVFFTMIFGALWWFARSQGGAPQASVRAAAARPASDREGGSAG